MEFPRSLRLLVFQMGVLGGVTVWTVYLVTHSGRLIIILTGRGVIMTGLGLGAAGSAGAGGPAGGGLVKASDGAERGNRLAGVMPMQPESGSPLHHQLAFYGLGLMLWGLVVLLTLHHTLQ